MRITSIVVLSVALGTMGPHAWGGQPKRGDAPASQLKTSEAFYAEDSEHGWYRPGAPREAKAEMPAPRPEDARPEPAPKATSGAGLAIPTGDRATSGLWIEKIVPKEVVVGQPFEYEIRATNLTAGALDNVQVWDSVPTNFQVDTVTPTATTGPNGMTWNLGTLNGHETKSMRVSGSAGGTGMVSGCAGGGYSQALCTSIAVVQPALRMTLAGPEEVTACDPIPLKLTVTNTGTGAARNVHVKHALPAGLKTSDGKSSLDFDAGTLAAGQSREFNFSAKADKTGLYSNSASAAGEGGLRAESSEISTKVTRPELAITQKGPERLFIGKAATYEITVTNNGDTTAMNTTVEDPVPSGAVFVSATDDGRASEGTVNWSLGKLAPKDSKTVHVTFNYAAIGEIHNIATAKAGCAAAVSASADTQMAGIPALMLNGFDDPDPVQVGDTVTYTLVLTNQGSAALTNVKLTCSMDEGDSMQYVSTTGASNVTAQGRTITFPAIARLDPNANATYKVVIKALKEGQVQFKAEAVSDQITRPLVKLETTNFYK